MARKTPSKETNGAAQPARSPRRETHGGYTPITGPITSVRQLVRGPNVARGSVGSHGSLEAYGQYLRGLTTADLQRHAIEEAHIVAIDDRDRLIKRLETEWSGAVAKEAHGSVNAGVPRRATFSPEQMEAQAAIKRKLLGDR